MTDDVAAMRVAYAAYVKATVDDGKQPFAFEKWARAARSWEVAGDTGPMPHQWAVVFNMVAS